MGKKRNHDMVIEKEELVVVRIPCSVAGIDVEKQAAEDGWKMFQPMRITKNVADMGVFVRNEEMMERLRVETAKKNGMERRVLALVKGKLTEDHVKAFAELGRIESAREFRSNSYGFVSIVRIWFVGDRVTSVKDWLFHHGLPVIGGRAQHTVPMPGKGSRGMKLACVGLKVLDLEEVVFEEEAMKLFEAIGKREDAAAIDNEKGRDQSVKFLGQEFQTLPEVFVPKPSSQCLVTACLELASSKKRRRDQQEESTTTKKKTIYDLGTGTGCLLLSFLKRTKQKNDRGWFGYGVDINPHALMLAKENAKQVGVEDMCSFVECNFDEQELGDFIPEQADMIICNPPYLPRGFSNIIYEGKEPCEAVNGGKDGLRFYHILARICPKVLKPNGYLIIEVRGNQMEQHDMIKSEEMLGKSFVFVGSRKDENDMVRCLLFELKKHQ